MCIGANEPEEPKRVCDGDWIIGAAGLDAMGHMGIVGVEMRRRVSMGDGKHP